MTTIATKADYVHRAAGAGHDGSHRCHARGCGAEVHPTLFMCKRHWWMVPPKLRGTIWRLYRPGQEQDKNPSAAYLAAARAAIDAVSRNEAQKRASGKVQS